MEVESKPKKVDWKEMESDPSFQKFISSAYGWQYPVSDAILMAVSPATLKSKVEMWAQHPNNCPNLPEAQKEARLATINNWVQCLCKMRDAARRRQKKKEAGEPAKPTKAAASKPPAKKKAATRVATAKSGIRKKATTTSVAMKLNGNSQSANGVDKQTLLAILEEMTDNNRRLQDTVTEATRFQADCILKLGFSL
jgi:hypothetical protein